MENPCKDIKPREGITITVELYETMIKHMEFLQCLRAAGVDNWEGYSDAQGMMGDG